MRTIEYYTDLQKQALRSIVRIAGEAEKKAAEREIDRLCDTIHVYGALAVKQFGDAVKIKAKSESTKIVRFRPDKENDHGDAGAIIPKRKYVGTITLMDIPNEKWRGVRSSPKSWSARNWAAASLWWCDGKRNLNEIKELVELEAGVPVNISDLVIYYTFLKEYELVDFVK